MNTIKVTNAEEVVTVFGPSKLPDITCFPKPYGLTVQPSSEHEEGEFFACESEQKFIHEMEFVYKPQLEMLDIMIYNQSVVQIFHGCGKCDIIFAKSEFSVVKGDYYILGNEIIIRCIITTPLRKKVTLLDIICMLDVNFSAFESCSVHEYDPDGENDDILKGQECLNGIKMQRFHTIKFTRETNNVISTL